MPKGKYIYTMPVEHKDLTGSALHEPKGISTAGVGAVYVANGTGSGAWLDRFSGLYIPTNNFVLNAPMLDVGVANTSVFFQLPFKCRINQLRCVAYDVIAGADGLLTIYIGGTPLSTEKLTLTSAGSFAGKGFNRTITTNVTDLAANTIVEVRSDGAPTNSFRGDVSLQLNAVA